MTDTPTPRLRVSHVIVQPVLVWDDGDELTPGPELNPASMPLSALADMAEQMRMEVQLIQDQILQADAAP